MKPLYAIPLGIAAAIGLGLLSYGMIYVGGAFNAARESQRTKVFEESVSYTRGMKTELGRIYIEYQSADTAGRIGMQAHVRDTWQAVDTSDYPAHLKTFLTELGVTQ